MGSEMECQPIVVNGIFYSTSPQLKLFALDASDGKKIWEFDPFKNGNSKNKQPAEASFTGKTAKDKRIIYTPPAQSFMPSARLRVSQLKVLGQDGKIDMHAGLDINHDVSNLYIAAQALA